jgi:hypothetical protein
MVIKRLIQRRIMCGRNPDIIPIDKCKDRHLYIIDARNASIGIFDKKTSSFIISRHKFKSNYLFKEDHWDHDDQYGTATPLKELEYVEYIGEEEELAYLNKRHEELEKDGSIE